MTKLIPFLILFLAFCTKKKKHFPQAPGIAEAGLYLYYGQSHVNDTVSHSAGWGPSLNENEKLLCIHSETEEFISEESGPVIKICTERNPLNHQMLDEILQSFRKEDELYRPYGTFLSGGKTIELNYLKLSEISEALSSENSLRVFAGDRFFLDEIRGTVSAGTELISAGGISEKNAETSYSLPYFSLIETSDFISIMFPVIYDGGNRKSSEYLVMKIPSGKNESESVRNFFGTIEEKNLLFRESCRNEKLKITEVMGSSESFTGKFIELSASETEIVCAQNVSLNAADESHSLSFPNGFILPGAVKILTEKNSPLYGMELSGFSWKEVKESSVIRISSGDFSDEFSLKGSVFKWEDEFYSRKPGRTSCSSGNNFYRKKKICADPGYHRERTDDSFYCSPSDFRLSEIQAEGIRNSRRTDIYGKFLELEYFGEKECDISGLEISTEEKSIPLSFSPKSARKGDIFLVGRENYFRNRGNLIRRNLAFLKYSSSVILRSASEEKVLFAGTDTETVVVSRDSRGSFHSVIFQDSRMILHPETNSGNFLSEFSDFNSASPGEKNPEPLISRASVSEVNPFGSYMNGVSVSEDRFIELKAESPGSAELVFEKNSVPVKWIFYLRNSLYETLSSGSLQCFPEVPTIYDPDLKISKELKNIALNGIRSDIPDLETAGSDERTPLKKRASAVNTFLRSEWTVSVSSQNLRMDERCRAETFASPGAENSWSSFLRAENGKLYIYSLINIYETAEVSVQSYFPSVSSLLNLPVFYDSGQPYFRESDAASASPSVQYLSIPPSGRSALLNFSGLYIEAVFPNPENQNDEWVLLCSRGNSEFPTAGLEIQDENSSDMLIPYLQRFGSIPPELN
ncbi:MAG TPA: hypothetical protein PKK94_14960, partial [Leptospiraceae bacterium]|nr:hypothetical protein [Leptospiraceae bacterium]